MRWTPSSEGTRPAETRRSLSRQSARRPSADTGAARISSKAAAAQIDVALRDLRRAMDALPNADGRAAAWKSPLRCQGPEILRLSLAEAGLKGAMERLNHSLGSSISTAASPATSAGATSPGSSRTQTTAPPPISRPTHDGISALFERSVGHHASELRSPLASRKVQSPHREEFGWGLSPVSHSPPVPWAPDSPPLPSLGQGPKGPPQGQLPAEFGGQCKGRPCSREGAGPLPRATSAAAGKLPPPRGLSLDPEASLVDAAQPGELQDFFEETEAQLKALIAAADRASKICPESVSLAGALRSAAGQELAALGAARATRSRLCSLRDACTEGRRVLENALEGELETSCSVRTSSARRSSLPLSPATSRGSRGRDAEEKPSGLLLERSSLMASPGLEVRQALLGQVFSGVASDMRRAVERIRATHRGSDSSCLSGVSPSFRFT